MGHKKVCMNCRKAFNKNPDFEIRSGMKCPECGQEMIEVNHKFRPPKKSDLKAWDVVNFLFQNGFVYQHIYKDTNERNGLVTKEKYVDYPTNMNEAKDFVVKYGAQVKKK